jgi:FixJ family two-component response regulator
MRETIVAVVDDDAGVLKAIERLLRAHSFHSAGFASAEAFLAWDRAGEAACLVLDINLRGMSGIELRHQLTAQGSRLPVIFISAAVDHATLREAIQAGCVACLRKPFQSRLLIDAIKNAIEEREAFNSESGEPYRGRPSRRRSCRRR